ncbi:acyltransferase [Kitasatospora sp. NPDC059673]|uniref:acyltransferase n=1 Tax=Kitasatospora sp. NPDC059673 TaxID=3346901 RepID=UPI003685FD41
MTGAPTSDTEIRTVRAGRPGPGPVRCSVGDLLLADLPVSVVLFHDRPLDADALATGLALALARLPEFAGRLRTTPDGELWIATDDSGVPFTVADSPHTITEAFDRTALPASGLVDHVRAAEARQTRLPLLTVRPTRLADGTGALGNLLGEIRLPWRPGTTPAQYAAELRTAVEEFTAPHLSLRSNQRFLQRIGRERITDCVPAGFDPARRALTISSWCRLGLHQLPLAGHRPIAFSPAATLQLPWSSWLVEGPGGEGLLWTLVLPTRLSARLRGAHDLLHPYRDASDLLPSVGPRKLL